MSIRFQIASTMVKASGMKKLFALPQPEPLPMPGLVIASSPGSAPFSDEEWRRMAELSPRDILVDAGF